MRENLPPNVLKGPAENTTRNSDMLSRNTNGATERKDTDIGAGAGAEAKTALESVIAREDIENVMNIDQETIVFGRGHHSVIGLSTNDLDPFQLTGIVITTKVANILEADLLDTAVAKVVTARAGRSRIADTNDTDQ